MPVLGFVTPPVSVIVIVDAALIADPDLETVITLEIIEQAPIDEVQTVVTKEHSEGNLTSSLPVDAGILFFVVTSIE